MKTPDELANVRKWRAIVSTIEEEENIIRGSFSTKSPAIESTGHGAGPTRDQKLANAITRLDELEQEKINCLNMIRFVTNKIRRLKNAEEIQLLHLFYIQGLTWEQTAEEMGYSLRGVFYIKDRAIKNYGRL